MNEIVEEQIISYEKHVKYTELGNAIRMVDKFFGQIKYCYKEKQWYYWNKKNWQCDETGKIRLYAEKTLQDMLSELLSSGDKSLRRHFHDTCKRTGLSSMIELAQHQPGVPIDPDDFDQDYYHLNCMNGTVDLRTGKLLPHAVGDLNSKITKINYNPDAECPRFLQFMNEITNNDNEMIEFLQKAIGYSLAGEPKERCLFILWGSGRNGKSTLINVITELGGSYWVGTTIDTLLRSKYHKIPEDLAHLKGRRIVTTSEPGKGVILDDGKIKMMTGRESINARFLRAKRFDYIPQFTIWISANHQPKIIDLSKGMKDRIRMIPFVNVFEGINEDKDLFNIGLKPEIAGILAWAIRGYGFYMTDGLEMSVNIKQTTEAFYHDMDIVQKFIEECCVFDGKIGSGDLFKEYKRYCERNNEYQQTNSDFNYVLTEKGFTQRPIHNKRTWFGITLKG